MFKRQYAAKISLLSGRRCSARTRADTSRQRGQSLSVLFPEFFPGKVFQIFLEWVLCFGGGLSADRLTVDCQGGIPLPPTKPPTTPTEGPGLPYEGGKYDRSPRVELYAGERHPPGCGFPTSVACRCIRKIMVGGEKKAGVTDLAGRPKQGSLQSTPIPCRYWRSYRFRVPSSTGR